MFCEEELDTGSIKAFYRRPVQKIKMLHDSRHTKQTVIHMSITEKSSEIFVLQDNFPYYPKDKRPSSPLSYTHAVPVKSLVLKERIFDPLY